MSWKTLRSQVGDLIESLDKMGEVSSTPKLDFEQYPGAYVIPSDNTSDFETNIENERAYAFFVRIFYETKNTGVADAVDKLEDAVDDIIDAIDQQDKKGSATRIVGINLPSKYTYLSVSATPSVWGELPTEDLIMAEIKVVVRVSFDATI